MRRCPTGRRVLEQQINVMRQQGIHEILAHDRLFSQQGFARLLDRKA
jgi:hypothetical protein